jgi:hypothetical protein
MIAKGIHAHRRIGGLPEDSLKLGNNEEEREGLRMHRNEEGVSKEEDDLGILRS